MKSFITLGPGEKHEGVLILLKYWYRSASANSAHSNYSMSALLPNLCNMMINCWARPRGYKTFFMLNSNKHVIFPAHKC